MCFRQILTVAHKWIKNNFSLLIINETEIVVVNSIINILSIHTVYAGY